MSDHDIDRLEERVRISERTQGAHVAQLEERIARLEKLVSNLRSEARKPKLPDNTKIREAKVPAKPLFKKSTP